MGKMYTMKAKMDTVKKDPWQPGLEMMELYDDEAIPGTFRVNIFPACI